ncbi:DUF4160 domain-containing protein [Pelagibacterium sp. 26DY04]|uniref:DUF4160 domain-containing protein n=1 Tax=Pelagibacterium sp. 26DY04 TaxID=2967130 RepID=UPI0028169E36|nr:DUF4160 domain-containing protein [Pelagibacterium sp. 26DY04]WMT85956.1 DUF4160 domain-containing protein [Pelagibacterium sp. 26DY04]
MYVRDHAPPHFHAFYGEDEALIEIETGAILSGKLPAAARRLVAEWAAVNIDALRANWLLREAGESPQPIEGLDAQ